MEDEVCARERRPQTFRFFDVAPDRPCAETAEDLVGMGTA
jgi:hypothetical protein